MQIHYYSKEKRKIKDNTCKLHSLETGGCVINFKLLRSAVRALK